MTIEKGNEKQTLVSFFGLLLFQLRAVAEAIAQACRETRGQKDKLTHYRIVVSL